MPFLGSLNLILHLYEIKSENIVFIDLSKNRFITFRIGYYFIT